jgi:hypothetical protein
MKGIRKVILPVPMLLFASVVELLPIVDVVHRPTSAPQPVMEVFSVALTVIAAEWAGWLAHWPLEQRW